MPDTPDHDAAELHNVACSCGRRWYQVIREKAEEIGREHDDSPNMTHVVTSPTAFLATS